MKQFRSEVGRAIRINLGPKHGEVPFPALPLKYRHNGRYLGMRRRSRGCTEAKLQEVDLVRGCELPDKNPGGGMEKNMGGQVTMNTAARRRSVTSSEGQRKEPMRREL
jgi:hypothetical protein